MTQTNNATGERQTTFNKQGENIFNAIQIALYRLSGGKLAGNFQGVPILLLTTTGRKTGKKRTTPVLYLKDNDQIVIVASHAGAPKHPGWWHNLQHHPRTEIQIQRNTLPVEAREATPAERERLWPMLIALYPDYANYQKRTTRTIPIVLLQTIK